MSGLGKVLGREQGEGGAMWKQESWEVRRPGPELLNQSSRSAQFISQVRACFWQTWRVDGTPIWIQFMLLLTKETPELFNRIRTAGELTLNRSVWLHIGTGFEGDEVWIGREQWQSPFHNHEHNIQRLGPRLPMCRKSWPNFLLQEAPLNICLCRYLSLICEHNSARAFVL